MDAQQEYELATRLPLPLAYVHDDDDDDDETQGEDTLRYMDQDFVPVATELKNRTLRVCLMPPLFDQPVLSPFHRTALLDAFPGTHDWYNKMDVVLGKQLFATEHIRYAMAHKIDFAIRSNALLGILEQHRCALAPQCFTRFARQCELFLLKVLPASVYVRIALAHSYNHSSKENKAVLAFIIEIIARWAITKETHRVTRITGVNFTTAYDFLRKKKVWHLRKNAIPKLLDTITLNKRYREGQPLANATQQKRVRSSAA